MLRYLSRRFVSGLVALALFQALIFFTIQLVFPGDYVSNFVLGMTREEMAAMRHEYGLDLPLWMQLFVWLRSLLTGTPAFYRAEFTNLMVNAAPGTIFIYATGIVLAAVAGIWLGRLVAWRGRGLISDAATLTSVLLYASFPPFMVMLLSQVIYGTPDRLTSPLDRTLGFWLKSSRSPAQVLLSLTIILLAAAAFMAVLSTASRRLFHRRIPLLAWLPGIIAILLGAPFLLGFGPQAVVVFKEAALAIVAYALLSMGEIVVIMRASMADTIHENYITTARAKGLKPVEVRDRHAARTAMLPVVSKMAISVPTLMGGIVMIESATGFDGLGTALFRAVMMQNMPLVMAAFLIIGLVSLAASLILETLLVVLDPRLRVLRVEAEAAR